MCKMKNLKKLNQMYLILDDVDEDMLENDIDGNVDMVNPFNTFSKPDDTNVELDEEAN